MSWASGSTVFGDSENCLPHFQRNRLTVVSAERLGALLFHVAHDSCECCCWSLHPGTFLEGKSDLKKHCNAVDAKQVLTVP